MKTETKRQYLWKPSLNSRINSLAHCIRTNRVQYKKLEKILIVLLRGLQNFGQDISVAKEKAVMSLLDYGHFCHGRLSSFYVLLDCYGRKTGTSTCAYWISSLDPRGKIVDIFPPSPRPVGRPAGRRCPGNVEPRARQVIARGRRRLTWRKATESVMKKISHVIPDTDGCCQTRTYTFAWTNTIGGKLRQRDKVVWINPDRRRRRDGRTILAQTCFQNKKKTI